MGHQTWGFDTTAERLGGHFRTQTKLKRVQNDMTSFMNSALLVILEGKMEVQLKMLGSKSCLYKLIKLNWVILEVKLKGLMQETVSISCGVPNFLSYY